MAVKRLCVVRYSIRRTLTVVFMLGSMTPRMCVCACVSEHGWQGIVGRKPTSEEITSGIGTCDLYM